MPKRPTQNIFSEAETAINFCADKESVEFSDIQSGYYLHFFQKNDTSIIDISEVTASERYITLKAERILYASFKVEVDEMVYSRKKTHSNHFMYKLPKKLYPEYYL